MYIAVRVDFMFATTIWSREEDMFLILTVKVLPEKYEQHHSRARPLIATQFFRWSINIVLSTVLNAGLRSRKKKI